MRVLWLMLLLGSVIWAEEQYFPHFKNKTWDEARLHCQTCFKDLTTITSRNVHLLVQNLFSDFWTGLRRSFNGSIPWSKWSNGDPVTYQNWYPGHPVPKPITCFSSLTPNSTIMNFTTVPQNNSTEDQCPLMMEILYCLNMTYADLENITRTSVSTAHNLYSSSQPVINSTFSITQECDGKAEEYIEDACVALLSYGMWKEIQCNESLPFICYDDRFFGQINTTNVDRSGGYLRWGPALENIDHYRVEVTGDMNMMTYNVSDLSLQLGNLTAGTRYNVQVYPVKCGRDLNPQNVSFYTSPYDVQNLTVMMVTNDKVHLRWNHSGSCDFYSIKALGEPVKENKKENKNKTETEITGLTPGNYYTFIVTAVVNETVESLSDSISTFTKPLTVRELKPDDDSHTVITSSWKAPEGNHSSYSICLCDSELVNGCSGCTNCSVTKTESKIFTDKEPGKTYLLCVRALTEDDNIAGETVQIKAYTRPKAVQILPLIPSDRWMMASWTLEGFHNNFSVSIEDAGDYKQASITPHLYYNFTNLKAAVKYTVKVITLSEKPGLTSDTATLSTYTNPTSPGPAKAIVHNQTSITLTWEVPNESKGASGVTYEVTYHSVYWHDSYKENVTREEKTFTGLKPGTQYDFTVCVVTDILRSDNVTVSNNTVPIKKTLTFAMLCSSSIALLCSDYTTVNQSLTELQHFFDKNLKGVYWNLKILDRK